jgi:regulator of protease activity HflC (stomatin/prohibitin superfamily)
MRYEIKDIQPPQTVLQAMELQVAAERQKRAQILDSEGSRQAKINNAEAAKAEVVLNSEALYTDQVNRAKGEAEAITLVANATATSIVTIAEAIQKKGGSDAVSLKVAEQYMAAFSNLAKENNTIIIPSNVNDPSSVVASAMAIFKQIGGKDKE